MQCEYLCMKFWIKLILKRGPSRICTLKRYLEILCPIGSMLDDVETKGASWQFRVKVVIQTKSFFCTECKNVGARTMADLPHELTKNSTRLLHAVMNFSIIAQPLFFVIEFLLVGVPRPLLILSLANSLICQSLDSFISSASEAQIWRSFCYFAGGKKSFVFPWHGWTNATNEVLLCEGWFSFPVCQHFFWRACQNATALYKLTEGSIPSFSPWRRQNGSVRSDKAQL